MDQLVSASLDRGSLEACEQLTEQHFSFSKKHISLQAGSFVHYLYFQGQSLYLCLRQSIEKKVFIEHRIPAVLNDGAPLFLLLTRIQVECYAAVDAFKVCLPVVKGLSCEHAHPQPGCLPVIVSAQPQFPPLVEVYSVLALTEVRCRCSPQATAFTSTEGGRGRAAHSAALHVGAVVC